MMYTNQIITVIDIQFKTVINVLKEKQYYKKKSSLLKRDIVWNFRKGFSKMALCSEAMNVEGQFFRCGEQHVQNHSVGESYMYVGGVDKAKGYWSKKPGKVNNSSSRTKDSHWIF